jgi:hypothetical protein
MFAVRRGEIRAGAIRHVLKIAVNMTSKAHVFPMTNSDGESSARYAPPEGTRLRLKPWINLKAMHLSRAQHIVAAALQRYGAIIGDQSGGPVSLKLSQGRHTHWGGILGPKSLRRFRLSDFEVVRLGYRG